MWFGVFCGGRFGGDVLLVLGSGDRLRLWLRLRLWGSLPLACGEAAKQLLPEDGFFLKLGRVQADGCFQRRAYGHIVRPLTEGLDNVEEPVSGFFEVEMVVKRGLEAVERLLSIRAQ